MAQNAVSGFETLLSNAKSQLSQNLNEAMECCISACELALRSEDKLQEAEARHLLSQIYFLQGNHASALGEVKIAIEHRQNASEKGKLAASLNSQGIYLDTLGEYADALDSYFKSLRIKEEINDKKGIANTLINIGSVYNRLGHFDSELKMYERSLAIAQEINDEKCIAYNHLNMGNLYSKTGDNDLALKYLNDIEIKLSNLGDFSNANKAVLCQGTIYMNMGDYTTAIAKYERFLREGEQRGNKTQEVVSLICLADVYVQTNELDKAKDLAERALQITEANGLKEYKKDALVTLSMYYEKRGNYAKALEQFKEHVVVKDDLLNANNMKSLQELHLKYDLDKKEKEAQIHQLKNVELRSAIEALKEEKERSDALLRNILPDEVAEELKQTGTSKARYYDSVTIMFIDIKNFTILSQRLSPQDLVNEIDFLFRKFDEIIASYDVEKIKTIGDAYMCAGGIPVANERSVENIADAAIEINRFMEDLKYSRELTSKPFFEIRIGINTGPAVAGIVGSSKFAYDIWGDSVNTAARMEQSADVGTINISGNTYELLKNNFDCKYRGKIHAKNKGEVDMYFLKGRKIL